MAKRWAPPDSIGTKERVGRRIFNEPVLRGAEGQPSFEGVPLRHFEDRRSENVSLDRLGATALDKKVVEFLKPRAEAHGRERTKPVRFEGWFHVAVRDLAEATRGPRFQVVSSPVNGPEPSDNPYHAHVVRPELVDDHFAALQLRHLFTRHGKLERCEEGEEGEEEQESLLGYLRRMVAQCIQSFNWLRVFRNKSNPDSPL